jgi:hypothetical protein
LDQLRIPAGKLRISSSVHLYRSNPEFHIRDLLAEEERRTSDLFPSLQNPRLNTEQRENFGQHIQQHQGKLSLLSSAFADSAERGDKAELDETSLLREVSKELPRMVRTRSKLSRDISLACGAFNVAVRFNGCPSAWAAVDETNRQIKMLDGKNREPFQFDQLFSESATNLDVCKGIGLHSFVSEMFDGRDTCVIAYGATGSGKTFAMSGPVCIRDVELVGEYEKDIGIIPRFVNDLFAHLALLNGKHAARNQEDVFDEYQLSLRCIQLYGNEVLDALQPGKRSRDKTCDPGKTRANSWGGAILKLRKKTECGVPADTSIFTLRKAEDVTVTAREPLVRTTEDCMQYIREATARRIEQQRSPGDASNSSRSHMIYGFRLARRRASKHPDCPGEQIDDLAQHSFATFVDMAGSEKAPAGSRAEDLRKTKEQTIPINESLTNSVRLIK